MSDISEALHSPLDRVPDGVCDIFLVNNGLTLKCITEGIVSDYELKISKSVAIWTCFDIGKKLQKFVFVNCINIIKFGTSCIYHTYLFGNHHLGQNMSEANKIYCDMWL